MWILIKVIYLWNYDVWKQFRVYICQIMSPIEVVAESFGHDSMPLQACLWIYLESFDVLAAKLWCRIIWHSLVLESQRCIVELGLTPTTKCEVSHVHQKSRINGSFVSYAIGMCNALSVLGMPYNVNDDPKINQWVTWLLHTWHHVAVSHIEHVEQAIQAAGPIRPLWTVSVGSDEGTEKG